jgi:hypothetical protein
MKLLVGLVQIGLHFYIYIYMFIVKILDIVFCARVFYVSKLTQVESNHFC